MHTLDKFTLVIVKHLNYGRWRTHMATCTFESHYENLIQSIVREWLSLNWDQEISLDNFYSRTRLYISSDNLSVCVVMITIGFLVVCRREAKGLLTLVKHCRCERNASCRVCGTNAAKMIIKAEAGFLFWGLLLAMTFSVKLFSP